MTRDYKKLLDGMSEEEIREGFRHLLAVSAITEPAWATLRAVLEPLSDDVGPDVAVGLVAAIVGYSQGRWPGAAEMLMDMLPELTDMVAEDGG